MRYIHSLNELSLQKSWLTIGVFDGVHLGHQEIIRTLVQGAKKAQTTSVVLSFYPHPAGVLGKRKEIKYLTTSHEKTELLAELGVDIFLEHPFNTQIAALTAERFMANLQTHLSPEKLLIGYDFALGKKRQGDAKKLTELGITNGYTVQTFSPVSHGTETVSSSLVREALLSGRVCNAHQLLGRPYSLRGVVVHGDGRGRTINIPTANLQVNEEKFLPRQGVYACRAYLNEREYQAVTNIGIRPTFNADQEKASIEVHLLDFDKNIYDETLKVEFLAHLRDEVKFSGVDALLKQIHTDIAKAKEILA